MKDLLQSIVLGDININPLDSNIKIILEERHRNSFNNLMKDIFDKGNNHTINPNNISEFNITKLFSPDWGNIEIEFRENKKKDE